MEKVRRSTRREVIRDGSTLAVAVLAVTPGAAFGGVAVPVRGGGPVFLSERELATLRALVDRIIPGERDGAVAGGCAEAIDALLGAFRSSPPRIYAGGPFSDRAGAKRNAFERFLRLDAYEEKAWRLRIEGSRGRRSLKFNGAVDGWQAIYRRGLKALDRAAGGSFASRSAAQRDAILEKAGTHVAALIDIAAPTTIQFLYGPPEYGANRKLVGWRSTGWPGDVQPRGWTKAQIEQPGTRAKAAAQTDIDPRVLQLGALGGSSEATHIALTRADGTLSGLRRELGSVLAEEDRRGA